MKRIIYTVSVAVLLVMHASTLCGQSLSADLNEAFYRNSYRLAERYFHKWLKQSRPADLDTVNDTIRHAYTLFGAYFSPEELHRLGGDAAQSLLYSQGRYLLINNRISLYMKDTVYYSPEYIAEQKQKYSNRLTLSASASTDQLPEKIKFASSFGYPEFGYMNAKIIDSLIEFRPHVTLKGKKVLYLTTEYLRALNLFLGANSNNLVRGEFKQTLGDIDITKRLQFINRYIPVKQGRLVDFHFNTYPAPYAITFDNGFAHARVDYIIGERLGFAVFKRTDKGWELLISSITGSI